MESHVRPTPAATSGFRPEIQALRAVAVLAVVGFHLWPTRLPGGFVGVDVFFVVSGFLITSHLVREVDATGTIRLAAFWARRARRLLPAALLVLASTLAAMLLVLPESSWQRWAVEIAAAGGYTLNWLLAAQAVDYFGAESAATGVQHYWSLSVEEQFYLVWPLLLLTAVGVARRTRGAPRRWIAGAVLVGGAASLAYSVWYSNRTPAAAYFSTFTHAWELAAGALLAVAISAPRGARRRPSPRAGALVTAAGILTITVCAFAYRGTMAFPGWVAAVPVAATLAVIAAADGGASRLSLMPVLGSRPVQLVGDVSYPVYLWHWPLIVLAPWALGRDLRLTDRLGLLVLTLVLAWATTRFVERPLRSWRPLTVRPRRALVAALTSAAAVAAVSGGVWAGVEARSTAAVQAAQDAAARAAEVVIPLTPEDGTTPAPTAQLCFGAGARLSGADCPSPFALDAELLLATKPVPRVEAPTLDLGGGLVAGVHGDVDGDVTIAVVGDSHAWHYMGALELLAARNGWRLLDVRHDDCTPSAPTFTSGMGVDDGESCQAFRQALIDVLPASPEVDVILTSSVAPRYAVFDAERRTAVVDAFTETYRAWAQGGTPVVVVADVPGPTDEIGETLDCVAEHADSYDPCTTERSAALEFDAQVPAALRLEGAGVRLVDFSDAYCDEDRCHSVIGGLVVYSGGAHLSSLFSQSLAPYLGPPLTAAVAQLP